MTESLKYNDSDTAISGVFTHGDDVLKFSTVETGDQVFEVTLEFHGLTLDALADLAKGVITLDGYSTANGADTALDDQDSAMISSFRKALDAQIPSKTGPANVVEILRGQVGQWEEWPHTVSLTLVTVTKTDRSVVKLCSYIGQYVQAQHDCNVCNGYSGQQNCQVWGEVGDTGTSSTYYYHSGTWNTTAFNHATLPYEEGDCFGRCGSDCGSGHVYSQDCHNHDSCVRNGHAIASAYCDDEFAACADDALSSNCY